MLRRQCPACKMSNDNTRKTCWNCDHSFMRRKSHFHQNDNWHTPPYALDCLFDYIFPGSYKLVWEPACGRGNIVKTLTRQGFKVIGTDIRTGTDFLTTNPPEGTDLIITNPPFSQKNEFIRRAYLLGLPFAFLMSLDALEGFKMRCLLKRIGIELVWPIKRIQYEDDSGALPGKCSFFSVWYCRKITGRKMRWNGQVYPWMYRHINKKGV